MASGVNRAVVERGSVNVTHTDVARASAYARSTEAKVNANAGWSSHHSRIAPAADGGPIRSAQNTSHNEDAATTSDKDSVTAPPVDHCGHDTAQAEYARALHSGPRLWSVERSNNACGSDCDHCRGLVRPRLSVLCGVRRRQGVQSLPVRH